MVFVLHPLWRGQGLCWFCYLRIASGKGDKLVRYNPPYLWHQVLAIAGVPLFLFSNWLEVGPPFEHYAEGRFRLPKTNLGRISLKSLSDALQQ